MTDGVNHRLCIIDILQVDINLHDTLLSWRPWRAKGYAIWAIDHCETAAGLVWTSARRLSTWISARGDLLSDKLRYRPNSTSPSSLRSRPVLRQGQMPVPQSQGTGCIAGLRHQSREMAISTSLGQVEGTLAATPQRGSGRLDNIRSIAREVGDAPSNSTPRPFQMAYLQPKSMNRLVRHPRWSAPHVWA